MKSIIFLIICLSISPSLSSIFADQGNGPSPSTQSKSELNNSYRKLYKEWLSFDQSQTIVRYTDSEGISKMFSPVNEMKKIQTHLAPMPQIALSPGSILNISIDFLNSVQHHIVQILYQKFKSIDLPLDVEIPGAKIKNIHVDLEDLEVKNLNLYLSEEDNSIMLGFSNLHFDTTADIEINKLNISEAGKVSIRVFLDQLIVKAIFQGDPSTPLMKPTFSVKLIDIKIPKDDLDIHVKLNYIPAFITDFLISFIKSTVLSKVEDYLYQFISGPGTEDLNKIIQEKYPTSLPLLNEELQISTFLTGPITVKANRILIGVDALAFRKSKGKGKRDFPSHMAFTSEDGNNIVFGVSQETIGSVIKTFVSDINQNHFDIDYLHFKGSVKSNLDQHSFEIWESGMSLKKVLFNGTLSYLGFKFDVNFKLDLKLVVDNIDFVNQKFIISVNKTELTEFSFSSNIPLISFFGQYLKPFIETFGNYFKNYAIPCSALTLPYDINVEKIKFRYENNFMVIKIDTGIKK